MMRNISEYYLNLYGTTSIQVQGGSNIIDIYWNPISLSPVVCVADGDGDFQSIDIGFFLSPSSVPKISRYVKSITVDGIRYHAFVEGFV